MSIVFACITAWGFRFALRRHATAIAPNCSGVVPNSTMCRRMIDAKYTGWGKNPIGTSRFCFNDWLACTSPGPPVIDDRCVAHATGKTFSTWRASPRAIAPAATCGAVPAQLIPPPHGDDHTS